MSAMTLAKIRQYLDLIRFSHTLFALPFALLGAALAAHGPAGWRGRPQDWLGILLCMATARSAAMAFNRLADRHYDALEPPHGRPPPARRPDERALGRGLHRDLLAGFRRRDAPVPAQSLAVVSFGSRVALASGLFLQQAIHQPGPFLAGRLAEPGPDRGLDRLARRSGVAAGLAGRWPCCSGCRGSISSTPARTSSSTERSNLRSVPKSVGVRRALWIAAACHALMIVPLVGWVWSTRLGPIYFPASRPWPLC